MVIYWSFDGDTMVIRPDLVTSVGSNKIIIRLLIRPYYYPDRGRELLTKGVIYCY